MQCTNKIRQFCLATQNFYDTYKRIPASMNDPIWIGINAPGGQAVGGTSYVRAHFVDYYSPFVSLLAFNEQQGMHAEIVSAVQYAAKNHPTSRAHVPQCFPETGDGANGTDQYTNSEGNWVDSPLRGRWDAMICPSDSNASMASMGNPLGNYRYSRGDIWCNANWGETRGPFGVGNAQPVTFEGISDGSSNTIFFSESCAGIQNSSDRSTKSGIAIDFSYPGNKPSTCAGYRGAGNEFISSVTTYEGRDPKGACWAFSGIMCSGFNTILPPNAPSAIGGGDRWAAGYITAGSYHPGGVNVGMGDAAVKFVSETIDCNDLTLHPGESFGATGGYKASDPHQWTGPSEYGIWGAAGTIAGRESKQLP